MLTACIRTLETWTREGKEETLLTQRKYLCAKECIYRNITISTHCTLSWLRYSGPFLLLAYRPLLHSTNFSPFNNDILSVKSRAYQAFSLRLFWYYRRATELVFVVYYILPSCVYYFIFDLRVFIRTSQGFLKTYLFRLNNRTVPGYFELFWWYINKTCWHHYFS